MGTSNLCKLFAASLLRHPDDMKTVLPFLDTPLCCLDTPFSFLDTPEYFLGTLVCTTLTT